MNSKVDETPHWLQQRDRFVPRGVVTAHPLVIDRAEGSQVWDVDGERYLDFVGGIGVLNIGHNHPRVVAAVQAQLQKVSHACFQVVAYRPYLDLARRLSQMIGGAEPYKAAFFTSGAEAVENAVKIARAHTQRPAVIAFRGGFHGRTLLGSTLTGMSQPYKQNFGTAPEVFHTPYPNAYRGVSSEMALQALQELFATQVAPERVAAIIIEPVQGDGGFLAAPAEFLQALRALATQHGIVLILDEIQTGFGRTGSWFGFQHAGIQPDLVTVAKSLAGGLPLSGVVGKAQIMDAPLPGGLGGTYGGNALACAAALAVLDAYEEEQLLARGVALGLRLREGLLRLQRLYPCIGDVRGSGFMLALELVKDDAARSPDAELTQRLIDQARLGGLLVIKCGVHRNVLRFLAPLVTTPEQIDEALAILDAALARVLN
ncbi:MULTISPECIES: 4-aminobutyrate--2-oxoglutarate transaminase [Pseudomonas]|jgi:4-aminobutyrate aminotransferase/(S)-3-amino-2-methylpropionate transaminase|uniref:4-aminobutyrate--2-oxoglutarate transaminase n=1 Tax=Pseudomonas TaxID=286 RepID=UPI00026E4F90|nr:MULTISPECIES: 4-aminobutyrate--2-oxoglutarate transaminase [Pseudomonas]EJL06873.1 4-aminobutyrate transaminase [Pseudomonas chlororaphis subsp. aureofaciens 30-84]ROL89343.1 4-aminobutyrate transaminase [Pseudomonas chlororaphis]RON93315.1 4-aminobutyrate transaminase [Pseudomonas chlororaphis]WPO48517.1 4-aminobutyrate--2-oxoglutarate transaminase [Pseudomonas sp. S1Bt23]SEK87654.1 4-aminobutyrate aminotransferase / (S)-3-amino-2-methylpropionate transaminase [Pseudomonas sp. NFACC41-3]